MQVERHPLVHTAHSLQGRNFININATLTHHYITMLNTGEQGKVTFKSLLLLTMTFAFDAFTTLSTIVPLLVATCTICFLASETLRRRRSRLPPGPAGWPLIGNLFDMPSGGDDWIEYRDMSVRCSAFSYYSSPWPT